MSDSIHSRFTDLSRVYYTRPETKPIYLVDVIKKLEKSFKKVSGNFLEWFGEGHEEMPGVLYNIGYGENKFSFTAGELNELFSKNFGRAPSVIQVLLTILENKRKFEIKNLVTVCLVEEKHKGNFCMVFTNGSIVDIKHVDKSFPLLAHSGIIFGSDDIHFLDEKQFVPQTQRFSFAVKHN